MQKLNNKILMILSALTLVLMLIAIAPTAGRHCNNDVDFIIDEIENAGAQIEFNNCSTSIAVSFGREISIRI